MAPSATALLPGISAVIPVYNSAPTLHDLLVRIEKVLRETAAPGQFEVVFVNDGSADDSWGALLHLAESRDWVQVINLMRNYGQHNAVLCGIRHARYGLVVTLDDDLQHPPEEIPKLLQKLNEGYDVVYGTPVLEQHGLFRSLASQVTKMVLQGAIGVEVARQVSAFRLFRRDLRNAFRDYNAPSVSIDVLLTWGTNKFAAVGVNHQPRRVGVSGYNLRQLIRHALTMTTGFSTLPLQFASVLGFVFTLLGIGMFLFVLIRYFAQGGSVPGFPFLASAIAIFSGAQLFALGIIGEYLARMHFRLMNRPSYTVLEIHRKVETENDVRVSKSVAP